MAYADFTFYTQEFCGAAIPEEAFGRCVARASEYLDALTSGAAQAEDDRVKRCASAIAEELYREELGGRVTSQTVGSWSQTYADSGSPLTRRISAIAARYLGRTGMLYRGV